MNAVLVSGLTLATAGCNPVSGDNKAAIANPASENCVRLGGRVELRSEPNGTVGYCHLPDGRVVEEWALFRAGADKSGE
jgi:putative hemolysin